MATFVFKSVFLGVTAFLLANLIALLTERTAPRSIEFPGSEVYAAIRAVQVPSKSQYLVVGDSVSHQLLENARLPGTLDATTNQAISMCGQYLLVSSALKRSPTIRQVTLAYQPFVFVNNLQQPFTFNYFVKPFYHYPDFRSEMNPEVLRLLNRQPSYRLATFPLFYDTGILGYIDYSANAEAPTYRYLAPVTIEYLTRLADLCQHRGVRLNIVSTPVSSARPFDCGLFLKEVAAARLGREFDGYLGTIRLVEPHQLRDGVHFKPEFLAGSTAPFLATLKAAQGTTGVK